MLPMSHPLFPETMTNRKLSFLKGSCLSATRSLMFSCGRFIDRPNKR